MATRASAQTTLIDLTDGYSVNSSVTAFTFAGDTTKVKSTQSFSAVISGLCGDTAVSAAVDTSKITLPTGLTVASDNDASSPTLTFTATTALTAAILSAFGSVVDIEVVLDGEVTLHTGIAIGIALTGAGGTAATAFDLQVSHAAVVKSESGTYSPAAIEINAYSHTGANALTAYAGRFIVETTTDGSTWTAAYTSSANESSKTYTIPSGITAMRVSLYKAGGTTVKFDQQTVPVVSDGATGDKGETGDVLTCILSNESHTFSAGVSAAVATNITVNVIAYKGAAQVAATIGTITGQVTGLTTSLVSNGTTSAGFKVTVTASLTTKSGVLKVPVTVDGKTITKEFSWSLALTGQTGSKGDKGDAGDDAVQIVIISSAGLIFKNTSVNTTLTAHVYAGGEEVTGTALSALGTLKWYQDGSSTAAGTGTTLTVTPAMVSSVGSFEVRLES